MHTNHKSPAEHVRVASVPLLSCLMPSSQHFITSPTPIVKTKGVPRSLEESNLLPFDSNVPVQRTRAHKNDQPHHTLPFFGTTVKFAPV
jgi:hypothetical protein